MIFYAFWTSVHLRPPSTSLGYGGLVLLCICLSTPPPTPISYYSTHSLNMLESGDVQHAKAQKLTAAANSGGFFSFGPKEVSLP